MARPDQTYVLRRPYCLLMLVFLVGDLIRLREPGNIHIQVIGIFDNITERTSPIPMY